MQGQFRLRERPDRLQAYLKPHLKDFVFGEFSPALLERKEFPEALREEMKGVAVPLREGDLRDFAGSKGLAPDRIADNMIWVMGCDPHFKYVDAYCRYIAAMFRGRPFQEILLGLAQEALDGERFDDALVHVRGALLLLETEQEEAQKAGEQTEAQKSEGQDEEKALLWRDALFAYAMVTRAMYKDEAGEDGELAGRCKAESLEALEVLAVEYPDYAAGQYHLGYGYANLGLYRKAQLTWEKYLEIVEREMGEGAGTEGPEVLDSTEERREIRERLAEIADPVTIEEGINHAQAARYDSAIACLEPFAEGRFADWWPIHYFLGLSYVGIGELDKAKTSLLRVLPLQPSHIETLEELAALYRVEGDEEKAEKYGRKAALVRAHLAEEQA